MKKRNFVLPIVFVVLLTGCFLSKKEDAQVKVTETMKETEKQIETTVESTSATKENITKKYDYFDTYDTEIKKEVENAVANSSSLQDEIDKIKKIADTYKDAATNANTQNEMNFSSAWAYTVWDKELNNLWERFSNKADKERKQSVLSEQRNWIAMKEEVIRENIGSSENGGSIYPML